jgi:inner membrane protein
MIAGRKLVSWPLICTGIAFAMLPDLDGITFRLGIPYASPFGHRGFSHSIVVALVCALLAAPLARSLGAKPLTAFLFLAFAMLSHGLLDAMTNRGNGVAFFWPFDTRRIFFHFRPIETSVAIGTALGVGAIVVDDTAGVFG